MNSSCSSDCSDQAGPVSMKKGTTRNHSEEATDDEMARLLEKETISPEDVIGLTKITSSKWSKLINLV